MTANASPSTPVSCGDNLSVPGKYVLESDLTCDKPLKINVSGVHLDLGGHTLSCSSPELWQFPPASAGTPTNDLNKWISGIEVNFRLDTFGSSVPNISNVQISNGSVTNCHDGIFVYHTVNSKFSHMELSGNLSDADCCFARGLELLESHDNHIVNNEMMRNVQGLAFFYSDNNQVAGNRMAENLYVGMYIVGSVENTFSGNRSNDNIWSGIWLEGSDANKIIGNEMNRNGDTGIILVVENSDNVIRGNQVNDNGYLDILFPGGIVLVGAPDFGLPMPAGNTIQANVVRGNVQYDLVETKILEFETFDYVTPVACSNLWKSNKSTVEFGPADCFD